MILFYVFFWNRDNDSAESEETLTQTVLQTRTLRKTRRTPWTKIFTIQVDNLVTRGVFSLLEFPPIHHVSSTHRHSRKLFVLFTRVMRVYRDGVLACVMSCLAMRDERRMTYCMYRKRSNESEGAEMTLAPCCEGPSVTSIDPVA